MTTDIDILIAGAGPTGLVLALWLAKYGLKLRIVDKTAEPGTTSRALAVHARTLELYRQLDLTDAVLERGHMVPAANLWARGEKRAHLDFTSIGAGFTPYAFLEIFAQDAHEKLLIERLAEFGIAVERETELTGYREDGDRVVARLRWPDGREEETTARYIAGCDGAHSRVREVAGLGFSGGTYRHLFYVADVEAAGPAVDGELHVDLDEADFLAIFALAKDTHVRLVGTVRDERASRADSLRFEDVSDRAIRNMKLEVRTVNWFSTYHVHHRVAEHFRKGRAFLLGDAAHIHSPVGGQGMNTGIGDAINLAWKLAAVIRGRAPETLLDSYEPERIAFARQLVATTDRGFRFVTAAGGFANFVRTRIAPRLMSVLVRLPAVRELMFRTVSQTEISYRHVALNSGKAGKVCGGDRLPWVADGPGYAAALAEMGWQVHVYGNATPALAEWCEANRVSLHVFAFTAAHDRAGLKRDAAYLLRPDTYVGCAEPSGAPEVLARWLAERGIAPTPLIEHPRAPA
ncbi:MAG: FAD-dependent monooxygenase [Alphaproteobacteria bacterium]|nr:FAD-dependent monooxygenase [Alphaproteobacteria bacterium]